MTFSTPNALADWVHEVCERQPEAAKLLRAPQEEQHRRGYFHTLREILQQPATWIRTSQQMSQRATELREFLEGARLVVLTGSGSSEYAGDCVRLPLQKQLGVNAVAIGGGAFLILPANPLPPERPGLVISLARSGDSPESVGALTLLLESDPELRHLVITCNAGGKLATSFRGNSRVHVVALDDETNDRSLVMTSSFTNLVIAVQSLGFVNTPNLYQAQCRQLSAIAFHLIETHFGTLAMTARSNFKRVVFLGTGARFGAAREAALKMLEMTAGKVWAMPETYLGLRHGPMSFVHEDTLVVCFLSSHSTARAYECDLIRELDQKGLGMVKVVIGDSVPADLLRKQDVLIECPGLAKVGDDASPVIDVVIGQLLAFFRCLEEGLRPDSPSESGVINRVVQSFTLHFPSDGKHNSSGDGK
ncbi:MAG: SIS domain-containing protein [Terriglobales bacterium]